MSEYQYYEFRAIDRPLTQKEMTELRAVSTRAKITPTSFTNTYNYGDFRGAPASLMERYFDAFVYVSNWGSRQLMLRIPRRFLDLEAAPPYCDDETLSLRVKGDHAVLDFSVGNDGDDYGDEDEDDWVEGGPWMFSLISLRDELMRGDFRALYLGWLASFRSRGWDDEDEWAEEETEGDDRFEPPVPPGLAKLSAPLRALAEFLRVDDELIQVASLGSADEPPAKPSIAGLADWVQGLSSPEKDAYLLRFLAEEGDVMLRAELSKRFREATTAKGSELNLAASRRTAGQLLAARAALIESKTRKAAERAARARVQLDRERAEARAKYLDTLPPRESAVWLEVDTLIATKLAKNYDRAVALLVDLRDLSQRSGRTSGTEARILKLRQQHSGKPSLIKRFDAKNLGRPK